MAISLASNARISSAIAGRWRLAFVRQTRDVSRWTWTARNGIFGCGDRQSDDTNRRDEGRLYGLHGKDSLAGTYGRSIPEPQYISSDRHPETVLVHTRYAVLR